MVTCASPHVLIPSYGDDCREHKREGERDVCEKLVETYAACRQKPVATVLGSIEADK